MMAETREEALRKGLEDAMIPVNYDPDAPIKVELSDYAIAHNEQICRVLDVALCEGCQAGIASGFSADDVQLCPKCLRVNAKEDFDG